MSHVPLEAIRYVHVSFPAINDSSLWKNSFSDSNIMILKFLGVICLKICKDLCMGFYSLKLESHPSLPQRKHHIFIKYELLDAISENNRCLF
jgi:hypothetical protein